MGSADDVEVAEELRQGLLAGDPLPAAMSLYSTEASLRETRVREETATALPFQERLGACLLCMAPAAEHLHAWACEPTIRPPIP